MQGFAQQTFAPEGRRSVATGGASPAAKRAERNPWAHSHLNHPAPEGRREVHGATKMPRSIFKRAPRKRALVNATPESFAAPGRNGDDEPVFHGFRVGPLRGRDAPPVATARRPVGARASSGKGKSLTCPTRLPASGTPADTVTDPSGWRRSPLIDTATSGV